MKLKTVLHIVCGGLLLAGLFGCGDVNWFPDSTDGSSSGSGASPDPFTFTTPVTVTQSEAATTGAVKVSNKVTVTGSSTSGWTVTASDVSTGANAKVSINGGDFTTSGTILPNQTLQIEITPSQTLFGQSTGRVKVGDYTTTFQVNTVADPV